MTERNEILLFGWVVVVVIGLSRFDVLFISGGRGMDERELRDWAIELERENDRLEAEAKAYQYRVGSLVSRAALAEDSERRVHRYLGEANAENERLAESVKYLSKESRGRLGVISRLRAQMSDMEKFAARTEVADLVSKINQLEAANRQLTEQRDESSEHLAEAFDEIAGLKAENDRLDAARKGWTDAIARSIQLRKAAEAVCDDLTAEIAELKAEIDRLTPPEGQLLSVSIVRDDDDQRGVFAEINFHNSKLETMFAGPQESAIGWMAKELGDYYGVCFTDPGGVAALLEERGGKARGK